MPATLKAMTLEAVRSLQAETSHVLDVSDFEDVLALDAAAARVLEPTEQAEIDLHDLPIPCGNVTLHKLTLGKAAWFEQYALKWFGEDEAFLDLVFGYLLTSPNGDTPFAALSDPQAARKTVEAWTRGLTCTADQFRQALLRAHPVVESDHESRAQYGPTCALLSREYGESPAYWFYEAHLDLARAMLADYTARIEAEHRAQRRAAHGKGSKLTAPPPTPTMHAHKRFRELKNTLRAKWQKNAPTS